MRRCALAIAVGGLLAGCGGDEKKETATVAVGGDDRAQVEALFRTYLDRLAEQDGAGACEAMAPSLQEKMFAAMRASGAGELVEGRSCGEVLDLIAEQSPGYREAAASLKHVRMTNMKIEGAEATYDWTLTIRGRKIVNKGAAGKTDGRWLITCCVPGQ